MKYFVNAKERIASGHENYIEFQLPWATEEFWDETSLYMLEETLEDTGFGHFWDDCTYDRIVFDMNSFTKGELAEMTNEAVKCGGIVLEVISELKDWVDSHLSKEKQAIWVNWECDRALARRSKQRDEYPVDPEFQKEVAEIDKTLSFSEREEAYEALLCKYNMPDCFFPFPLYEPDKW